MTRGALSLSLAGVSLRVVPHALERQAARGRYLPFTVPDRPGAIEIVSGFDPALKPPLSGAAWPGATCERDGEQLIFSRRDDRLIWDVKARRGRFVVARTPPAEPLPSQVPPFVENALRMVLATELVAAGGLLLHASGWADRERAVIFPAFSGGGKTTTAFKLPDDQVLSDDQVAIRDGDAWSLPFVGEWGRRTAPRHAPLQAIALLGKSATPQLARLPPARALARLLGCVVSFDPRQTEAAFTLAERLVRQVPVYELALARDTPLRPWIERMCGQGPESGEFPGAGEENSSPGC